MSLPVYDATKHHVGLGAEAGSELGFILAGAYRKAFRRELGDSRDGVHYGSDSFFNQPGLSSWTMDDFTGGAYQQVYGKDPAMFSSCENLLPAQFDRSLRTVAPMQPISDAGAAYDIPICAYARSGYFCVLFPDRFYRVNVATGAYTYTDPLVGTPGVLSHAVYDRRSGYVFATYVNSVSGAAGVALLDPDTGNLSAAGTVEPGAAVGSGVFTGIDCDGDRLVVAANNVVFTVQLGTNAATDVDTDWTRVGRLPAPFVASAWMGQQLYILCGGADSGASVAAFDGVQVLPVTDLPFNFFPKSICGYAGRIYVGGSGLDIGGSEAYAELHEITGSSVRLVKTFAPETRSGRYGGPPVLDAMCVHEGLLFFGDSSRGLIAYDVTTDSLYGAHDFDNVQGAFGTRRLLSLVSYRSRLWGHMYVADNLNFCGAWMTPLAGDAVGSNFAGTLVTSDFGPELDRLKRWKSVRLLTRGDTGIPTVEASVDGGSSWTSCPLTDTDGAGTAAFRTYDLSAIAASRMVRLRLKLPRNNSPASFGELVAFSAAFQLVDSDAIHADGTEKVAWSFVVAGVDTVELEDGSAFPQRLGELKTQLWEWARSRELLSFIDADGSRYDVEVDSLSETQPDVLPAVAFDDPLDEGADSGREAFYALTVVEA